MPIAFNQIPGNLRVPFLSFEVNAGASPYQTIQKLVLMGQKTSAGTAIANEPVLVTGGEDGMFGVGSMLASMYKTARANAPYQEIWATPLDDAAGATAATGTLLVSTAATPLSAAGTCVLYIGGIRVATPINTIMTAAQIATAMVAQINACVAMQVTASVNGITANQVDLVANNAGTLGNSINILTSFYSDDGLVSKNILTVTKMAGGAGDPLIADTIANLADGPWNWVVMPYCQSSYIAQIDQWLTSRWGPLSQTYGHCLTAMSGSAGTVQAFTSALNSWHVTIMPSYNAPHPTYLWAAAIGAQAAQHLQSPPELSRPMQDVELVGLLPPVALADRWSVPQRQSFYYAGASGYVVQNGAVYIDRLITTYQRDPYGLPDQSWLDINTIAQIMYGLPYIAAYMTQTYPRSALVNSNPNNIQGFVTTKDLRNAFVHCYKGLEAIGVFQDAETFASLLVVERNAQDPNRVDTYLPTEGVNGLRVMAVNATSYLQYPTA